jgi:hypothetical protein
VEVETREMQQESVMPSISEDGPFTVIVELDVDPATVETLIAEVADEFTRTFPGRDGFISASFHASVDGRRVVNYAPWTSREAWERATSLSADHTARLEQHRGRHPARDRSHDPLGRRLPGGAGGRAVVTPAGVIVRSTPTQPART